MGLKTKLLLATLSCSVVATLAMVTLSSQAGSPERLVDGLLACNGESACVDMLLGSAETTTIRSSIKPVIAATKVSGGGSSIDCHAVMHKLGAALNRAGISTMSEALGEDWSACGMGLMHGFVETMDFTVHPEPVATAFDFCQEWAGTTMGDALKKYLCLHAVGHSFSSTSKDTPAAEIMCTMLPTDDASGACLTGVYMQKRDVTLPETVVSLSQVMAVCDGASDAERCLVVLYEPVIQRWGTFGSETASLDEKCRKVTDGRGDQGLLCASFLGRAIAAVSSDPLLEVGFCSGSTTERRCFEGFFDFAALFDRDVSRMRDDVCDRHGYCAVKP